MIIGYARVSTDDQKLEPQTDALTAAGAERIFADKITGTKRSRPQLDLMIDQLRQGDVVVVAKYDRLARSLKDLLDIVEAIAARGAGFRSLAEDIDTTTPAGRLVFHVFASISHWGADSTDRGAADRFDRALAGLGHSLDRADAANESVGRCREQVAGHTEELEREIARAAQRDRGWDWGM